MQRSTSYAVSVVAMSVHARSMRVADSVVVVRLAGLAGMIVLAVAVFDAADAPAMFRARSVYEYVLPAVTVSV